MGLNGDEGFVVRSASGFTPALPDRQEAELARAAIAAAVLAERARILEIVRDVLRHEWRGTVDRIEERVTCPA